MFKFLHKDGNSNTFNYNMKLEPLLKDISCENLYYTHRSPSTHNEANSEDNHSKKTL